MPAPLSIVIPTLNAANCLGQVAACLMEGLNDGLVRELVVSDGGSDDATVAMAERLGARIVTGASGRGGQLRRGADAAKGDWMLFLHADTQLSPGWSVVVADHIQAQGQAGYFRLQFNASGFRPWLFAAGANVRARLGLPYGDQGLLISRDLYDQVGGYADIVLMEDVAMAKALRGQMCMLKAQAVTDASRYQNGGWYRRGVRNVWTLLRYQFGAAPQKLARSYNRF
ncbi:MAG: TIGR04283 family arsenosugar biosynthesis glycosyltransferase [Paracoccaceae bacterium]